MKIALLAHNLRKGGGLVVGRNFIDALRDVAPHHKYLVCVPSSVGYEQIKLPGGSSFYFCRPGRFLGRTGLEFVTLPRLIREFAPDVLLALGNQGILDINCPQAIWVQSGYLVYSLRQFGKVSWKDRLRVRLQRAVLRVCLRRTQLLFCQTPVMQQRLAAHYGYDIAKIKILPNALSGFLAEPRDKNDVIKKPECLSEDKFNCLILTQYSPHKNPEMIMEICLRNSERLKGIKFITTVSEQGSLAGRRFVGRVEAHSHLRELIQDVGPIPHEQLEAYYRNIQLVIIPSLMESFSATYLEAMYFGVPILTTDFDFARYLCGDAAVYYDPRQPESLIKEILALKSDFLLREKLVQAGRERYKRFSHSWNEVVGAALYELERMAASHSQKCFLG